MRKIPIHQVKSAFIFGCCFAGRAKLLEFGNYQPIEAKKHAAGIAAEAVTLGRLPSEIRAGALVI